jgi:hypothetical protein
MLIVSRPLMPAVAALVLAAAMTVPAAVAASAAVSPRVDLPSTAIGWSGALPVPGSRTRLGPALTTINFPAKKNDPVALWAGPSVSATVDRISYAAATNLSAGRWTRPALVDGGLAHTDQRPAAAPFGSNPASQIIVVWKQSQSRQLRYSVGSAEKGGVLKWANGGKPLSVPSAVTNSAPAVYSPQHSQFVVVAWTAATGNAVDVLVGVPLSTGLVRWGTVTRIAGAKASGSPAIAEANAPGVAVGVGGRLFVLWRSAGKSGRINTSFTADPLSLQPQFSQPQTLSPQITTSASPAAQAIGADGTFPLLLVYLAAGSTTFRYVTLSAQGTTSKPLRVPSLKSLDAPAEWDNIVAATALPPKGGSKTGQPVEYVRICPGC